MLGSSVEEARHPLGVLPLTVSVDGSDASLALLVDVKPTTAHWIIEAESTWLTADSGVFEKPIVKAAEDVNGRPSTRVVSCTFVLFICARQFLMVQFLIMVVPKDFQLTSGCVCNRR